MVIERFRDGRERAVYRRLERHGRLVPDGLSYRESWVEPNLDRCFQLVECEDPDCLERWAEEWEDLVEFEFVRVVTGAEMAERMTGERNSGR